MFYPEITQEQQALIETSPLFFIASAAPGLPSGPDGSGPVNLSPRGAPGLHVLSPKRVAFLDYKGSGDETRRHGEAGGETTVMVCAFDENAAIVRLYGRASAAPLDESPLTERLLAEVAEEDRKGLRQVITVDVASTQTSCGYGVPVMDFVRNRRKEDRGRAYK